MPNDSATDEGSTSPLSEPMTRLLELFATDLAKLRFGDLDAAALNEAAGAVRAAARDVAEAEALAATARTALEAAREALLHKGQRALAHARIYAEGQPELAERLDGITLAGSRRVEPRAITPELADATPRRRGRPPKASAVTGTLALGGAPGAPANGTSAAEGELGAG
jgi:hypothetical protein